MLITQADLANKQHAEAVLALLDDYASGTAGGGQPLSDFTRQHLVTRLQQRQGAVIILAFDESKPVGLVIGFEGFSTFMCRPLLNIHDVVVLAEYRGQSIAAKMIQVVEHIARERGCCKLTLEVLANNQPAQSAYRKAGFVAYQLDPVMGQAMFWEKKL